MGQQWWDFIHFGVSLLHVILRKLIQEYCWTIFRRLGAPAALLYPWCLHTIGDSLRHFLSQLLFYLWKVHLHQSCLDYLFPRCAQVVTSISFLRHSFKTFYTKRETSLFENRSSVHWLCLDKNEEAMFLFPTNIWETRFEYYQVTENKELKELWFSHWNEE